METKILSDEIAKCRAIRESATLCMKILSATHGSTPEGDPRYVYSQELRTEASKTLMENLTALKNTVANLTCGSAQ